MVFAPSAAEMYPKNGSDAFVDVPGISERLDGHSRPGHFRGVATVVSKLFTILAPDRAFFGQKDAAQVAVLQAMVRDLNFPVELIVCPTVRDPDGLALSSRNRFLTPEQRRQALSLSRSLRCAAAAIERGERSAELLKAKMHHHLVESPDLRLDYVEAVDHRTLLPQTDVDRSTLLAVAGWLGDTRLIDNLPVASILPVSER